MSGKRFKWEDVYKWEVPAFLEVMNGLNEKNEQLKEENRRLKKENAYLSKELDYYYGRSVINKKRFMIDDAGSLIDIQTRKYYDYVSDVVDLLNELSSENEGLKKENKTLLKYLKPFNNLARDYHLTYELLFEITQEAIEKGDSK